MSEEEELIIISGPKRTTAARSEPDNSMDTVYDTARALIDAAELANTPIVFQPLDHTPQDPES